MKLVKWIYTDFFCYAEMNVGIRDFYYWGFDPLLFANCFSWNPVNGY